MVLDTHDKYTVFALKKSYNSVDFKFCIFSLAILFQELISKGCAKTFFTFLFIYVYTHPACLFLKLHNYCITVHTIYPITNSSEILQGGRAW